MKVESGFEIPGRILNTQTKQLISNQLLLCLRQGADLTPLAELSLEEWMMLVRQADRQSLAPMLYQRLRHARSRQILAPLEASIKLRQSYYQTFAENMHSYAILGQVLEQMLGDEIRVILLKGAYLAEKVYGDIGLRPMGDLDLLVPPEDFQRSLDLLNAMGFTSKTPYSVEVNGVLYNEAPSLTKDGVVIDLHWDLVPRSSPVQIDIQRLWGRARPVTMKNGHAWTLSPEDLLLFLCIHASYGHKFRAQLRSLVDISEVLHHSDQTLDWDTLIDTVGRWGAERGVYLSLTLVGDLLEVDIPAELLTAVKPTDWTPQALHWASQQLFREGPDPGYNFLRIMNEDLPPERRFQALLQGIFPPRPVMTYIFGFPPGSWQITARYLPYAAGAIRRNWGHFLSRVRGDPRQQEAQITLALQDWLGINK